MSTNPTSGLTGQDHTTATTHDTTTNSQGGILDTVKSYVGLSPTASRDATSGTTDATTEPAFGAAVGPNASHSHTGTGAGASEFGATHTGTHTGTGTGTGIGSSSLGSSTLGSSNVGAGYTPAPTLNPHDEERAKVVADRATGGVGGSSHSSSGLGSTGAGIGSGVGLGSGVGSGVGHDSSRGSGVGLGSGVGHDSSRGSGVGLGSGVGSGVGHDSSRGSGVGLGSGVGSGVGHDSSHGSGVGLDSSRGSGVGSSAGLGPDGRDSARGAGVGSGVGLDSSRGSGAGLTSDNTSRAGERSEVAGSQEHTTHHTDNKTAAKRENKDAIPTAGGIKLGEKHWGESDIVPDNPKPRADENISSASGQPDQLTSDNTNANTGSATSPGSGEHKEGIADKVKHTLHIGGSK